MRGVHKESVQNEGMNHALQTLVQVPGEIIMTSATNRVLESINKVRLRRTHEPTARKKYDE